MMVQENKVYVEVRSEKDENDWDIPVLLIYEDEKFEVKKPQRSMKLINNAIRYKCFVDERQVELFNSGDEWWINR